MTMPEFDKMTSPPHSAEDALAIMLARLASLQGHAVPRHRFSMMSESAEGTPLAGLSLVSRAVELWKARFPAGDIRALTLPLEPGEAPALWIDETTAGDSPRQILVVRGALSGGVLSCVALDGQALELPGAEAQRGVLLALRADEPQGEGPATERSDSDHRKSRTASQWFRHAIYKRKRIFFEGAIATTTLNAIGLASAFYTMQIYDRVVPTQGYSTLWVLTVGVLIAMALELLMRQVRARLVERGCKAIDEELSGVFFGHALSIRMDQRPRTVGTFASQIRHFESVRNFMTSSALFVLADAPFSILFVLVIGMLAGPVALIPALFLPASLLVGLAFRKPLARLTEAHMEESNRKNGVLIEAIDGIESVKAASAEWKMLDHWRALTNTLARDEVAMKDLTALSTNITQTLQQLCYVGLVFAGTYAIGTGDLTVGGLIACTIISGRALGPIAQISGLMVQWQHSRVALKGLDGIMAMPGDTQPGERRIVPDRCQGNLRAEALRFGYGPDAPALSVDALRLQPGERVAVLGAVGSGKSSLIKVLSGLYRPTEGRVFVDDVDVAHLAPEFVREHIGYLPQDVRLFQGTLRDNLALGLPSPTDEQILDAARLTGLDRLIAGHPRGLGIEISEGGRGLSGGQRQLVGLTRLVLARPRVMLLDEPTASMDPQLEEHVAEHVFGHRPQDTTLVVVTHKLGMLRHFTRIVVLDRGRIVADGSRDEIIRRMRDGAANQDKG
jgi:ATP-binding cassette subfamily C protein LapB